MGGGTGGEATAVATATAAAAAVGAAAEANGLRRPYWIELLAARTPPRASGSPANCLNMVTSAKLNSARRDARQEKWGKWANERQERKREIGRERELKRGRGAGKKAGGHSFYFS